MGWTLVEEESLQLPYSGLQHAVQWQAEETQADPNPAMLCCLHLLPPHYANQPVSGRRRYAALLLSMV